MGETQSSPGRYGPETPERYPVFIANGPRPPARGIHVKKETLVKRISGAFVLAAGLALSGATSRATPTTTYWTPAAIDFQPPDKTHFSFDAYSTPGSDGPDNGGEIFPIAYGLTWGARLGKASAEYGFDYFTPADDPLFFNAKVGFAEGVLSANAPAVQLGLVNFGTKKRVTNQNIVHLIVGKSLPNNAGRLSGSLYVGNAGTLRNSHGDRENTGYMIAYDRPLSDRFLFVADYASGDNAIGGGGFGLAYQISDNAGIVAGPVWYNDREINGRSKFTVQLDVNF